MLMLFFTTGKSGDNLSRTHINYDDDVSNAQKIRRRHVSHPENTTTTSRTAGKHDDDVCHTRTFRRHLSHQENGAKHSPQGT